MLSLKSWNRKYGVRLLTDGRQGPSLAEAPGCGRLYKAPALFFNTLRTAVIGVIDNQRGRVAGFDLPGEEKFYCAGGIKVVYFPRAGVVENDEHGLRLNKS